jgi:hypothetical protein
MVFDIHPHAPFRCEAKFPRGLSDLLPNALSHPLVVSIPRVRSTWHRGPRKKHLRHGPVRYTDAHWVCVQPVVHSLVEGLLKV